MHAYLLHVFFNGIVIVFLTVMLMIFRTYRVCLKNLADSIANPLSTQIIIKVLFDISLQPPNTWL